ncbi:nuclear pore complex protein Nup155-like isoform X1 [Dromaius novaehollandiae]|uniref:nuclear pore complex protein Nup155-like isoform X1 n=2 Tax=Dromaius novaehollandiae TaxID=8790 RepID=UPI00311EB9B3
MCQAEVRRARSACRDLAGRAAAGSELAPSRRALRRRRSPASSPGAAMPAAISPAAPTAQEALEIAGRIIDRQIQDDRCYPDLSELLAVPAPGSPTVSGMSDMDYPLQGPGLLSIPNLPEISPVRRVPLPPELVEQFGHMQCNCMMGVFPEISRAWLTIDSDIFMWNYEDGGDLAYFDGLSETILAVGLVKPKGGIFQPHVRHLLVLATAVDIVILGLSCANLQAGSGALNDSMSGGMQLLPDPLYSLPTDNICMLAIASADNGRIFLAGKDGCLYEVAYQAEAGWFSQRCRKINHSKGTLSFLIPSLLQFTFSEDDPVVQIAIDNSRNILYTRSEKGVLQVYDLGQDGQGMTRVTSLSQNAVVSAAGNIARTIDRSVFKPIVQIAVIENSESIDCQLLAITHAGVRLYFSTSQFKHPTARPSMLTLVHVRLPPGFSASSNVEKPSKVHRALYSKGVLLMAASENEDNDILWCINHDSFPFQKPMMETQMTTRVDGHSWALSAIDEFKIQKIITPLNKDIIPITDSPVVVQQHMLPPKKFVLLSAQGSFMFHKLRPVDQLRHLLVSSIGGDGEEIERFFKLHQEDQACATCLILACSNAACDREVSAWATRAFFRYGGEAQMRFPSALPPPSNVGPILGSPVPAGSPLTVDSPYPNPSFLTTPGQGLQPPSMSTPMFPSGNSMSHPGTSISGMMGPEIVFSGRHNGICIYFARIIGNIWDGSIVVERVFKSGNREAVAVESSVPSHVLECILQELKGLQEFLDRNSQFATVGALGNPSFSTPANLQQRLLGFMRPDGGSSQQVQQELQRKFHAEAQLTEKTSLQGIQQLVRKTCQALALWKLLCEHQFNVVVGELQKELQEHLKITAFKDLVIRDRELTGALIASLINCYIRDNAAVDGISAHLQDICPLLYSTDDAVCSKANELLQRSRQAQSKAEKEKMLRESLKEYQKISNQLDLANVCAQYRQVRFYEGVVELSLTAAEKKDPQGLGLHFYKNGEPEEDVVGLQAFQERLNSYKCITDTLQELVNQSKAAPQSPSVPKKPGPPVLSSDPNMLSNEEAGHHFEQMLKLAQRSTDELFSIALYNWLIQVDLADKLLQVTAPFLEPYLVRMTKIDQNKVRYMDLLWRYFEKNRNFSNAARVLAKLADLHSTEISLQQRLEYIARAILSAKSSTAISSIAADGEFLHELEEKMEVARIQLQIQETLQRQYSHHSSVQKAISQLDAELMDITKLYGEFADPFKLSECKLAIIHCAGHSDPILVQTLWQEIIEKELSDSVSLSPADRMQALSLKMVLLGKIYAGTPRYFPLDFIVQFLEQQVCTLNWDVGFVTYTMQEMGVPLPRLLEVYDQLFKARDPYWNRMKKPLHLLECIHVLLSGYVHDPSRVLHFERRRFTNVCLDAVSCYLVELQSMSPTLMVQTTVGNFKSLQAKLERLH